MYQDNLHTVRWLDSVTRQGTKDKQKITRHMICILQQGWVLRLATYYNVTGSQGIQTMTSRVPKQLHTAGYHDKLTKGLSTHNSLMIVSEKSV